MNSRSSSYRLIFFSSLIWGLLILSAPVAIHLQASGVAQIIYGFFSRICHQLDSHSLHLFNTKLAVCARCSAIYFGFFLSIIFYPLFFHRRVSLKLRVSEVRPAPLLVLSILPLLFDVALDITGIHASTLISRLITGGLFGFALPFVLLPRAEEAFRELSFNTSLSLWRKIRHAE